MVPCTYGARTAWANNKRFPLTADFHLERGITRCVRMLLECLLEHAQQAAVVQGAGQIIHGGIPSRGRRLNGCRHIQ